MFFELIDLLGFYRYLKGCPKKLFFAKPKNKLLSTGNIQSGLGVNTNIYLSSLFLLKVQYFSG